MLRNAYLVYHRFLGREVSKVEKLHLLYLVSVLFFMHVSMSGGGHRVGVDPNIGWDVVCGMV
jgi:hypothetical protein